MKARLLLLVLVALGWHALSPRRAWPSHSSALVTPFADSGRATPQLKIKIGSKAFTESVVLGELIAHLAESAAARPEHRRRLGGTQVLWQALLGGEIDIYAEYTGTISEEILAGKGVRGEEAIRRVLTDQGVGMSRPLGFNNAYAIGMRREVAARRAIRTISDLARHPELKLGFSNEFMDREDGWPSLRRRYSLPHAGVRGLHHDLAYAGLQAGSIDATDLYSTDAEIGHHNLVVLQDDQHHFPAYHAVLLYRAELNERMPKVLAAVLKLENFIDESSMIAMNARVKFKNVSESRAAAEFLAEGMKLEATVRDETITQRLFRNTAEHLYLVAISLAGAIVVAVPLGILAARRPGVGQVVLGVAGIVQTVPSLAILAFMIPFLGLGGPPAITALFLYSLLPIVRNTYTGLHDIPGPIRESADALGLPASARLRLVELPMASRAILAGIKTSAVINVGTATIGAIIGAGGYGQPIVTGIELRNTGLILQGAIPAALLALAVQGLFELVERWLVPKGLRLRPTG